MKKEDLTALGLSDEQIAGVQKLNGIDIESEKKKLSKVEVERDNYKGQLETAQNTLKAFEGVDVTELKGKIETLNNDLLKKEKEYQNKLSDMEFNSLLDSAISQTGAKSAKAVKAFIDIETLKSSKNQSDDIKNALEAIKTENDYLFTSTEPIKNAVAATNTPNVTGITKEVFAKMGYADRVNLKKTDPEKYNELKG